MIGGFRKNIKRTNIRKKIITTVGSDDEEGEIENDTIANPPPIPLLAAPVVEAPIVKIKNKNKKNTTTSLSFGDELEKEDQFVLKRSKASLTLNEQVKREKKQKKKKESVVDDKKLVYETPKIILAQPEIPFTTNGTKLSTLNDDIKTIDEANAIQADLDDNAEHHFSIRKTLCNPGDIPDAATIYAMKKKREQARQFGGEINYIPLDSNKHEGRFKPGSSRLVREEMDDSSDEDRMEMKGTSDMSHPALERRKQVAKALEEVQENNTEVEKDDDDDVLRWEDEQMKKGSTIPTNQPEKTYGPKLPNQKTVVAGMVMDVNTFNAAMGLPTPTYDYNPTGYSSLVYAPTYSAPLEQTVITVELVEKRLSEQLDTKKQLYRLHQQQCEKTKFDLDYSKENIVTLERKAVDVSDRFTFYQDIRGYIKDLLECLHEKVVYLLLNSF